MWAGKAMKWASSRYFSLVSHGAIAQSRDFPIASAIAGFACLVETIAYS